MYLNSLYLDTLKGITYIKIKVFIYTLINTQMYLNTAQLWISKLRVRRVELPLHYNMGRKSVSLAENK